MDYGFEYEMFPMGSCIDHLIPIWWQYLGSFLGGSRSWRWVLESWIGPQSLPWFPYPLWGEAPPLPISVTVVFFLETWGRASPDRTLWDHQQRRSFPFYVVCDKHFLRVMRQSSESWRESIQSPEQPQMVFPMIFAFLPHQEAYTHGQESPLQCWVDSWGRILFSNENLLFAVMDFALASPPLSVWFLGACK